MRLPRLLTLFFCVIGLDALRVSSEVCPAGAIYNAQLDKCYTFVNAPKQFTLAEQDCIALGGHLTSVRNGFENTLISENAVQIFNGGNATDFFIGGNDLTTPGTWAWVDGTAFLYTNWGNGQPQSGSDCIATSIQNGKWSSVDCFGQRPYVCEVPQITFSTCPPPPSCPTVTCPAPPVCTVRSCPGSCPSEWSYFAPQDSCYKVFWEHKWDDAEAQCVSEGSHMTSIHSEEENTFIANLAASHEKLATDRMTWIGLHIVNSHWVWTDGTPSDYFNWAPKQPDNSGKENCVQIFSDQSEWPAEENWYEKWNNYDCNKNMRNFVCKKPATH